MKTQSYEGSSNEFIISVNNYVANLTGTKSNFWCKIDDEECKKHRYGESLFEHFCQYEGILKCTMNIAL